MALCPWVCWASFASLSYLCLKRKTNNTNMNALDKSLDEFLRERRRGDSRNDREGLFWLVYLSMFSMSVPTSHWSCRKSMGEEDLSSRMGTSELSSILKSTRGSESLPAAGDTESSHEAPLASPSAHKLTSLGCIVKMTSLKLKLHILKQPCLFLTVWTVAGWSGWMENIWLYCSIWNDPSSYIFAVFVCFVCFFLIWIK